MAIIARGVKDGMKDSTLLTGLFSTTSTVADPTFSTIQPGNFTSAQNITIACATANAQMSYTTDGGSTPSQTVGTSYNTAIHVASNTMIIVRVIAYITDWITSGILGGIFAVMDTPVAGAAPGQVTVTWPSVSGASSYNVYWAAGGTVTKAGTKVINAMSPFVKTGLSNGTQYAFIVTTVNGTWESDPTAVVTAIPALSAPSLSTAAVTSVASTSAVCGGTIGSDGGAAVTARGSCWATTANPTIAGSKTVDGAGIGTFSSSLSPLSPGTTYHVRAYATNSVGTSYGSDSSFTALNVPTVTTVAPFSIGVTTASSGGNVIVDGGATVTSRGVCWNTSSNPTISNSRTVDGNGTGVFSSSIASLVSGTLYHVRAYATNIVGTGYGADLTFTTLAIPTLATSAVSSITGTTASGGGTISSDGGASVTVRGVCWSTAANPTTSGSKTTDGTGIGTFTSSLTGLANGTTYHVRAYATNSIGTGYGTDMSFSTLNIPTLTTTAITSITTTTASSGGSISADGGAAVSTRGVCWSTSANPTTANSKNSSGTGTGSYSIAMTGLVRGTTYHVRAYATNTVGTAYGADVSLMTKHSIGEAYGGGIVFYVDITGYHGLIAAANDIPGTYLWCLAGLENVVCNTTLTFGTGQTNTTSIVAKLGAGNYAASLCDSYNSNGYTDWYLPSAEELVYLYNACALVGGFTGTYYWSSSEGFYLDTASYVWFWDGSVTQYVKNAWYSVRAIRTF